MNTSDAKLRKGRALPVSVIDACRDRREPAPSKASHLLLVALTLLLAFSAFSAKKRYVEPSYAWRATGPLGLRELADMDTLLYNYQRRSVPSFVSNAWACTGNLGAEGLNMVYMDRKSPSQFFFNDAISHWMPTAEKQLWYNTRIPSTMLSYNTGGGSENTQNRLKAEFTGNATRRIQIGAHLDYLYSKGSYQYQAVSDMSWGLSGSYTGERYQVQAFYNHWNMLNKENGGITDALYITDPAELQGGDSKISSKSIPTNLTASHSRVIGQQLWINNRYNVGYWRTEIVKDTIEKHTYVPVTAFTWTLDYRSNKHLFLNSSAIEDRSFWQNHYIDYGATADSTRQWSLTNTLGVDLIEGFNKRVPFGLGVYARHEVQQFRQLMSSSDAAAISLGDTLLTPIPAGVDVAATSTRNRAWAGAVLTKQQGAWLTLSASGELGLLGDAAADIIIDASAASKFKILGDSAGVGVDFAFHNEAPPYLMEKFVSNHFVWDNDFGKTRTLRLGGHIDLPWTGTRLEAMVDNVQNALYFGPDYLPAQEGGSVQVFAARLHQDLHYGILHWRNTLVYQTTSNDRVIPLPAFAWYSNLYIWFRIAGVMQVQLGVDCDYYTSYYSPTYQPATMTFANQRDTKVGNYPFMNAYVNFQLKQARFYVMMSHINQGLIGGDNYFSMPLYPLNPRRFQMGVIVNFLN